MGVRRTCGAGTWPFRRSPHPPADHPFGRCAGLRKTMHGGLGHVVDIVAVVATGRGRIADARVRGGVIHLRLRAHRCGQLDQANGAGRHCLRLHCGHHRGAPWHHWRMDLVDAVRRGQRHQVAVQHQLGLQLFHPHVLLDLRVYILWPSGAFCRHLRMPRLHPRQYLHRMGIGRCERLRGVATGRMAGRLGLFY